MNKRKNKTSKLVILAIGIILAFMLSLIFPVDNAVSAFAAKTEAFTSEPKIISRVTLDEDFDDSSVIVVMNKRVGGLNKRHKDSFFGNFAKKAVYDLTYTPNAAKSIGLDDGDFGQILKIDLPINSKQNVIDVIHHLEKIDGVLAAEPNYISRSALKPPSATKPATGTHRYPSLWGLHGNYGIQAENAWNITTGDRNSVRVGVIDSEMENHPDIAANRVNEGGDFANMKNVSQNIPGPLKSNVNGHGTHVSGTIGATGVNANGVTGVAWKVQLIPLQVASVEIDSKTGKGMWVWKIDTIIRAINWARTNNVDIINFSGGMNSDSAALQNAINNFQGLFVAAAGNGDEDEIGLNNDTNRFYPSDYSRGKPFSNRVISVGAIDQTGNRPVFSNWGEKSVSIFAPGVDIWSTVPNTINLSGYAAASGTSMAAPHVTGTAALMWSIYANSSNSLTRAQRAANIKATIINNATTDDAGTPLNNLCVSDGRLNAFKSVSAIAFKTSSVTGGISLNGLVDGFSLADNTKLILPDRFAPVSNIVPLAQQSVVAIGSSAFANQTQMSQITIPAGVLSIGANAFYNCTSLSIFPEAESKPSGWHINWNSSNCQVYWGNAHVEHHYSYTWKNGTQHARICVCQIGGIEGHVVSGNSGIMNVIMNPNAVPSVIYCLLCGGPVDLGIIQLGIVRPMMLLNIPQELAPDGSYYPVTSFYYGDVLILNYEDSVMFGANAMLNDSIANVYDIC